MASLVAALLWLQIALAHAAPPAGPELSVASGGLWRDVEQRDVQAAGERTTVPESYRLVALDRDVFREQFFKAPMEGSAAALRDAVIVTIPMPDGGVARFWIQETQVMAPELAAKFPDIRTWTGQGIDDPAATARLDWTPQGFHAMVLSPVTGRVFIDPYRRGDTSLYISYFRRDLVAPERSQFFEYPPEDPDGRMGAEINKLISISPQLSSGAQLRTYRLAVAATGEYTAFHGGTVGAGQAAIVTAINRVNGIYEVEVAVRLQLVANNNLIVYTNAVTDPYTNNDGPTMLGENQDNLDAVILPGNYDIGHVFSTGGGGVATLRVPCKDGSKARGVTGSSNPTGDGFWVDYVAHEMGHQFGGNHSFNGNAGSCGGGNRNGSTAYEPGSGSTIMAYAGICGAQNLQAHSDAYFHSVNFDEIVAYTTTGAGNGCAVITATGNNLPVPSVPAGGFTIPKQTPFALTGSATDADGDLLSYNWEEYDLGSAGPPGVATNPPFFRSWNSTISPTRTFPLLSNLLANTLATGEVLPNTTRALKFRMTVRDNHAGGGGVAYSEINFNVTAAAGPFKVTSPDTAVTWGLGSSQTVTWNVANTTAAPVACANVAIELSTDGGNSFPTVLAANTPNDGSQSVTMPNTATTMARIKVRCSSNVFFDISDTNFSIGTVVGPIVTTSPATAIGTTGATLNGTVSSNGASTTVSFQYGTTLAYGSNATAAQSPLAAGATNAAVSAAIGGLVCNTLYHYRVVGANSDGTANGSDRTFTTASCGNSGLGTATIVANPYGTVNVTGATLNGNTISNFQSNAVIQLGTTPGAAGSFAQIDWQGLNLAPSATLTIRSRAAGQSVMIRNVNGVASAINGMLTGQGGNGAAPPALYVANPAGINVAAGGAMQSSSGLIVDALDNTWTTGANIVNAGVVDGGTQLELYGAKINGGGAFKGNTISIATFGSANNPVNGAFFLSNSLQLFPSTGDSLSLILNAYGSTPQVLNLMANGNASVWMPSAWPAGFTVPQNNAVLPPGGVRPPGQPEPGYGGGSMIVQATGNLQLVDGGSNDFVFPGGIVFRAAGTIDVKGVVVNQGWNTSGKSFQGVYFESPVIGSSIGNIEVYSNDLNWTNFSTFPGAPVRVSTLVRNPDGSASYVPADATAPHLNTYSILVGAAANGQCWTCLINNLPVNMYGP